MSSQIQLVHLYHLVISYYKEAILFAGLNAGSTREVAKGGQYAILLAKVEAGQTQALTATATHTDCRVYVPGQIVKGRFFRYVGETERLIFQHLYYFQVFDVVRGFRQYIMVAQYQLEG